jgi:hypothetical protein
MKSIRAEVRDEPGPFAPCRLSRPRRGGCPDARRGDHGDGAPGPAGSATGTRTRAAAGPVADPEPDADPRADADSAASSDAGSHASADPCAHADAASLHVADPDPIGTVPARW